MHSLQVKLLLQPLKGQDPSSEKQLCLLDFLSTPKQIRRHIVQALLSKLAEISDPECAVAAQSPATEAEASQPPSAEPSPRETFTEGMQWLPSATQLCSFCMSERERERFLIHEDTRGILQPLRCVAVW